MRLLRERTTCSGTVPLVAVSGGREIRLTNGALEVGASCMITLDVAPFGGGLVTHITQGVTSSLGDSAPVEATLMVNPAVAPGFSAVFSPARTSQGDVATLTYTIDNGINGIEAGSLAFETTLPAGLVVAAESDASTTCGQGRVAATVGVATLSLGGGEIADGQSCPLSVDVQPVRAGTLETTSGDLRSDPPDPPLVAPGATATLTVEQAPLSVTMAFAPAQIVQGGVSRLRYRLE